ncbi:hypothetical protein Patl1_12505 [Pistacia atlantica]|uniref:Uncharacterized protein n=1 Tax=Pistacia atlantica TaxID=434234 RepID=A0ACC1ATN8_9ROSI|nr:hypothetical protein Patl1_12505 [Pistacia atlantica]
MATILNFLSAIIFLSFISRGYCQCVVQNVTVNQSQTGSQVQNKPEWKVTISNPCRCTVLDLTLSCTGFQTVEKIDPSVLSKSGDNCLINNGNPIVGLSTFSFNYAWDSSFSLTPVSAQIACS